jgi:hypothetical protein
VAVLITEEYRAQQKHLHDNTVYGTASAKFAPLVARLIDQYAISELLDYGAGSRFTLIRTISDKRLAKSKFDYHPYEPAIPAYAAEPEPREMVACIDVLEHIEPECLDDVLNDLKRCTLRIGLFTVHCGPAAKVLPDGRNAHLIQEPPEWWLPKITDRFTLQTFQRTPDGFTVLVSP